jgi:hypothetical protein
MWMIHDQLHKLQNIDVALCGKPGFNVIDLHWFEVLDRKEEKDLMLTNNIPKVQLVVLTQSLGSKTLNNDNNTLLV